MFEIAVKRLVQRLLKRIGGRKSFPRLHLFSVNCHRVFKTDRRRDKSSSIRNQRNKGQYFAVKFPAGVCSVEQGSVGVKPLTALLPFKLR